MKPHEAHLRIAALEMEKERKVREKTVALERIASIERRIAEIEEESARIACDLEPVTKLPAGRKARDSGTHSDAASVGRDQPLASGAGHASFRIRY